MDVPVTIAEAIEAGVLNPPMTEAQLRAIINALHIQPSGTRRNGRAGHPATTWSWTEITKLHAALLPWLQLHGTMCLIPHARTQVNHGRQRQTHGQEASGLRLGEP